MNYKLASTLSAVALALVAYTPHSFAKVYTPGAFNAELKKRLTKKTGAGAYIAATSFLKLALTDKKNKGFVATYTNVAVASLKKPRVLSVPLQVAAATYLANAFTTGYFRANAYNIDDPKFVQALKKTLTLVTGANRSTPNARKIAAKYLQFVRVKGRNSPVDQNFVNKTVYIGLGQRNYPIIPVS